VINCTKVDCFLYQQFTERTNQKAVTVMPREKDERERDVGGKQEPEETLLDSLNPLLRLSVSAVCTKGILLWQNVNLPDTSLCLAEQLLLITLLIRCTDTNCCIRICMYKCGNECSPTSMNSLTKA